MTSYMPIRQSDKHFGYPHANARDGDGVPHPAPPSIWHRFARYANTFSIYLVAILLLINIVMLMRTANQPYRLSTSQHSDNLVPENFRIHGSNIRYMSLDRKFDPLWEDMLRRDSGNVYIPSGKENSSDVGAIGVISMFHQLHCLAHMRKALQDSQEGKDIGKDPRDNGHWPHCMDYLRQTFLCQADDVLERLPFIDGANVAIDGADDVRRCRNSQQLFDLRGQYGSKRYQNLS